MGKLIKDLNRILDVYIIIIILMIIFINSYTPDVIHTFSDASRTVFTKGPPTEKVIALSFDDGPHPKYTNQILDLLKEHDISGTFFVLGKHAELYPEIIKRQISEGHEIGNHSYSHVNMKKASKEIIKQEFEKTQEIIYSISKTKSRVFRPPYGNYNKEVIKVINNGDSTLVLWTFYQDSKDWSNPEVDVIVDTTLSNIQNGDIILFHDYVYKPTSNTVEALKKIIPALINEGYAFVTISELINLAQEEQTLNNFK